jgi:hypothetical protein
VKSNSIGAVLLALSLLLLLRALASNPVNAPSDEQHTHDREGRSTVGPDERERAR